MSIKDDNIPLADDDPQGNFDLSIDCFQSKLIMQFSLNLFRHN